jgi:hypothetical protein
MLVLVNRRFRDLEKRVRALETDKRRPACCCCCFSFSCIRRTWSAIPAATVVALMAYLVYLVAGSPPDAPFVLPDVVRIWRSS